MEEAHMGLIKIAREADVKHVFRDGLSRFPVLVGEYSQAAFEKCALKPGATWSPRLYGDQEKNQLFLFSKGAGYLTTPRRAFNIKEVCVFVPEFDTEPFTIHAAADSPCDLEFLHIETLMSDYDKTCVRESRMTLPRFRGLSECWTYRENFTGAGIRQHMVLEHRNLGRLSMGANLGQGPTFIGQHIHNELEQWYYVLPGASFTYTAEGEEVRLQGGDLTYTRHGSHHGSRVAEGEKCDYVWFELCEDGYPGEIK
jgi:mannose-6-phosphate isomerase-like protein (cupin superfamily)